jgi:hypothetical protein
MKTKYRQISFSIGDSIESAVKMLQECNFLACGTFNGVTLYSDIDNLESAYKKITGISKSDFDAKLKADNDKYKEQQRKHKESIPKLTKEWIKKGENILDKKYHEHWNKIVPIRLSDLYQGMELGNCLDIVKELNAGCELETAKKIIEDQEHSGMSFGLVCSMVKAFCDRGAEFVTYVRS